MIDAFKPVRDLESAVCEYTGAPYAVAVNSCTAALMLACAWHFRRQYEVPFRGWVTPSVEIPRRTYVSVPMSIMHAGGSPTFRDEEWTGYYQLKSHRIWDSARWFSSGMFNWIRDTEEPSFVCVSFHARKTLGFEQGGAILHDSSEADAWLRRARFDGRTEGVAPKDDTFTQIGWHCYMNPTTAAGLLWHLAYLPQHNEPLPNDEYADLSAMEIFR